MHGLRDQGEKVDQQGNHVTSVFGLVGLLLKSEASHDSCVQPGQNWTLNQTAGLPVACATRQPSGGNQPRCDPIKRKAGNEGGDSKSDVTVGRPKLSKIPSG